MLDATDAMAGMEAAPSAETLDRLRQGWRYAMTALPLIGGIFASVTLIHDHVLGLVSAGMGLAGILCFVVARSRVRRYAAWSTLLALWVLGYWQIASVLVGFAVFSSVASPGWTLLLAGLYLPAFAYAFRVYFRGYAAGWEKHRRFNSYSRSFQS